MFSPAGETTTPRAILTGHDYEITCAAICAELGLVLSGSQGKIGFGRGICFSLFSKPVNTDEVASCPLKL